MACGKIFKASNKNFKLKNRGMESRQLRIGDWVSHEGKEGKVVEIKTTHTRLLFKDDTSYLYNVNELEPIPLTDELIKKIGFNSNNSGEYINIIGRVCLSIMELSNCYYLVFVNYDMDNDLLDKTIKYLHQLQHELYDAGIELKIEL